MGKLQSTIDAISSWFTVKALVGSAAAFAMLAFGLISDHPTWATFALAASVISLVGGLRLEAHTIPTASKQGWLLFAGIYFFVVLGLAKLHSDASGSRHFKKYLVAHDCVHAGEELIHVSAGRCDNRTGMCDEGGDTYESNYVCQNGYRITYKDFVDGNYGIPKE